MNVSPADPLLRHVRRFAAAHRPAAVPDAELLRRFAAAADDWAFAALVQRHGPAVFRACRRVLPDANDAEDAFQATFLLLARKAASLRQGERVGNWLYGVASRLARKLRDAAARRRRHEARAAARGASAPADELTLREARAVLDEELDRLPGALREPLRLCCLEGRTRDEAARQLGWSLGTLKRRLERGRALLRGKLARRGLTLPAALAAAALLPGRTPAAPPAAAVDALLEAARRVRAGESTAGVVSARAAALARPSGGAITVRAVVGAVFLAGALAAATLPALPADPADPPTAAPPSAPTPAAPVARGDLLGDPLPPGALARLGTVRLRHGAFVSAVALSGDGKVLVSVGRDATARVWDPGTGKEVRRFPADGVVGKFALALVPDGKRVATGLGNDAVAWDVATGKEVRRYAAGSTPICLAFSPDGGLLAGKDSDGKLRLWDAGSGTELLSWAVEAGPGGLAFTPDSSKILTCGDGNPAVFWDAATGKAVRYFEGQRGGALSAAASPDGKTIASGGADGSLVLWDAATARQLRRVAAHKYRTTAVAFTPDGRRVVTAALDGAVRLWDVATGAPAGEVTGLPSGTDAAAVAGDTLACVGGDNAVRLWDVRAAKDPLPLPGHRGYVRTLAFSADSRRVLSIGDDWTCRRWDAGTGREVGRSRLPGEPVAQAVALAPAARLLATAGAGSISLFDTEGLRAVRRLGDDHGYPNALAFDGAGGVLASAGEDGTLRIWDAAAGGERSRVEGLGGRVENLTLSADGRTVAAALGTNNPTEFTVRAWDARAGAERPDLLERGGRTDSVALSPDGRFLAASSRDCDLRLWDLAAGGPPRSLQTGDGRFLGTVPVPVAFSPDGRSLATGVNLRPGPELVRAIRVLEVATGRERCTFTGNGGEVWSLAFSPDGRRLATSNADSTALVWDLARTADGGANPGEADALWAGLGSDDPAEAYRALCRLANAPEVAVAAVAARLRPVPTVAPQRLAGLLAGIDADTFAARQRAARDLTELGPAAEPAVRRALEDNLSAEARRQLRALRDRLDRWSPDRLRAARAVEVLELIGTHEALRELRGLAAGAEGAWLTREAGAALARLEAR